MQLNTNDVITQQLSAQISELNEQLGIYKERASACHGYILDIAKQCCDDQYGATQLGGDNDFLKKSDAEMRDFIISNVRNQKTQLINSITTMQQEYITKSDQLDEYADKYLIEKNRRESLEKKNVALQQQIQLMEAAGGKPVPPIDTDFKPAPPKQEDAFQATEDISVAAPVVDRKGARKVFDGDDVYNLDDTIAKLNSMMEDVVRIIGNTGFSESTEIRKACIQKNQSLNDTTLRDLFDKLAELHVISQQDISTPIRSRFRLIGLTSLGDAIYKDLEGKNPKKSEMKMMEEMHASIKHGYCIKDTASILKEQGYKDVSYNDKDNTFKISGGRSYIPDITAKLDNDKKFFELELGHHTNDDFAEKLDKAAKLTDTLFIIAPDAQTKESLRKQVFYYKQKVMKQGAEVRLVIYLGTMTELQKRRIFNNDDECKINVVVSK